MKKFTILFLFSLTLNLLTTCTTSDDKKSPNILFIAVDDLRPELGCYGNEYVKSPNIDRLAENGIVFTQSYCQSAVCNPSRASLLTGLRPDRIKVWDLRTDFRDTSPDVITLPQHFKNNGYHTVGIGKIYHNTLPDSLSWSEPKLHIAGYPFDPDAVYRDEKNVASLEKRKQKIIAEGREKRYIDRIGEWYLKDVAYEIVDAPDDVYFDGAQTDVALKKIEELSNKEKPFFFAIGFYRPHLPFNVPKKYWDMYERENIPLAKNNFVPKDAPLMAINNLRELRGYTDFKTILHPIDGQLNEDQTRALKHGYLASVSYIDAQVGKLINKLKELRVDDNTIIVLWGDHGWKLGEHASWCKMTNYEIDTKVPLMFSTPQLKGKSIKSSRLIEFVDIYPTLCELAGIPIPETLEGISALPLFENPDRPWKKAAFSQFLREGIWVAPDGIEYMGYSIRTEEYRYTEWVNWESKELVAIELYDQLADPDENINIAGPEENKSIITELSEKLKLGWRAALPDN
ncbi:MAG: sulfatase [Ignavibacterium sp.]|nr:MAG: sulfatase [Ignavibacterium sp.]